MIQHVTFERRGGVALLMTARGKGSHHRKTPADTRETKDTRDKRDKKYKKRSKRKKEGGEKRIIGKKRKK